MPRLPVPPLQLRPWQRHSLVLAVAGAVYVAVGFVYVLVPATPSRTAGLAVLLEIAPLAAWGWVWILVGLLALLSTRWPPASKTWGYTGLTTVALVWASGYLVGVLLLDAPTSSISGALVWFLVGFLWWAIAGLVNPDDLPLPQAHENEPLNDPER